MHECLKRVKTKCGEKIHAELKSCRELLPQRFMTLTDYDSASKLINYADVLNLKYVSIAINELKKNSTDDQTIMNIFPISCSIKYCKIEKKNLWNYMLNVSSIRWFSYFHSLNISIQNWQHSVFFFHNFYATFTLKVLLILILVVRWGVTL